ENSKQQPLHRVIFGLGIRHVGETMAKTLARSISHIKELYGWDEEKLITLEDVGPKVAVSIVDFFALPENRHMMDVLEQKGVRLNQTPSDPSSNEGIFADKTFLFTGSLSRFKRSDAEAMVEAQGGKILSGVSSKLHYLVVGADAGSKLEKAKKLGTVHILSEEDFLKLISS